MSRPPAADVAVVGARGRTGRWVVAALRERGAAVREVVHRPAVAGEGAVAAELRDTRSLEDAFRGCAAVHLIPPLMHPAEDALVANAAAAAGAVGARRFVLHSVLRPGTPQLPHHLRKARSEAVVHVCPLEWTILQPGTYVQNFSGRVVVRDGVGVLATPYSPRAPLSATDLGDIAEATALVHAQAGHGHASYELVGPQPLSHLEIAELLGAAHGATVSVEVVPLERALAPGLTLGQRADYAAMFAHYDEHGFVGSPTVLAALLGRAPTTFATAAARDLAAAAAAIPHPTRQEPPA
jgi:uncharacterized protein YbjT (DUF2867 family)